MASCLCILLSDAGTGLGRIHECANSESTVMTVLPSQAITEQASTPSELRTVARLFHYIIHGSRHITLLD
jgi:hypothetical protein